MKILPNILTIGWALLILGSLFLTGSAPAGANAAARASARVEIFLLWEATALVVAMIAAGLSLGRADKRRSKLWWMGWGPLLGSLGIAVFVGLAVIVSRVL